MPQIHPETRQRFRRITAAGIFFQGGAAAADPRTIVAALVDRLTESALAVGAAAAILRYGWLFPQLFVAYFAQRRSRRMPFYKLGAFGRAACLAGVALAVALAGPLPGFLVVSAFFALWTLYAFVSGIVAVPYNDIVARSVPSAARSRLLAARFFGGGLLALAVAAAAHRLLEVLPFPADYAAILFLGALLLLVSTLSFVWAGEPQAPLPLSDSHRFRDFLRQGLDISRNDSHFRLFVYTGWCERLVSMALPFYVVAAADFGISDAEVALLLGAQTGGAIVVNPLWGWWGDRLGKRRLLEATAALSLVAPLAMLAWLNLPMVHSETMPLPWFAAVFFVLGAVGNGATIAQLGYLMEISPDDRRPAYSGYFNALIAPAALAPIIGGGLVSLTGLAPVFAAAGVAAVMQWFFARRLRSIEGKDVTV